MTRLTTTGGQIKLTRALLAVDFQVQLTCDKHRLRLQILFLHRNLQYRTRFCPLEDSMSCHYHHRRSNGHLSMTLNIQSPRFFYKTASQRIQMGCRSYGMYEAWFCRGNWGFLFYSPSRPPAFQLMIFGPCDLREPSLQITIWLNSRQFNDEKNTHMYFGTCVWSCSGRSPRSKGVGGQTNSRSPPSQYIRLEVREYELLTC
ncbi:hypothetical protein I7I53_07735 [Histoplasma capsulatum var. duboisii H88]|uniref:Uncharacterized protein n=1 Tax=Ajellomyces capsulatus (strain H88) TaxID=544711 RepID=A0A8A1LCQ4_AJEC8|nr:hypothetical protein I7I53_07735 [Histoplasma capsulatum var. duboisii H88]